MPKLFIPFGEWTPDLPEFLNPNSNQRSEHGIRLSEKVATSFDEITQRARNRGPQDAAHQSRTAEPADFELR